MNKLKNTTIKLEGNKILRRKQTFKKKKTSRIKITKNAASERCSPKTAVPQVSKHKEK